MATSDFARDGFVAREWNPGIQQQKHMIKKTLLLFAFLASLVMSVTACHTVHGAGEDISTAGDKLQEHTPP